MTIDNLPEIPSSPTTTGDYADIEAALNRLRCSADQSTANRSFTVTALYDELQYQLKKFYACREMSLAVTNLQQSWLWRNEAGRLWANAESSPHAPDCNQGDKCGEPSGCPPPS